MRALIERRHEEIVQLIQRLVQIESPSGDVEGSSLHGGAQALTLA
jgi:hypothetical protein